MIAETLLILSTAKVMADLSKSDKYSKKTECVMLNSAKTKFKAERLHELDRKKLEHSIETFANRKRAVFNSTFPFFKKLYDKLMEVEISGNSNGIEELFGKKFYNEYSINMSDILRIESIELSNKQLVCSDVLPVVVGNMMSMGMGVLWAVSGSILQDAKNELTEARAVRKQVDMYNEAVSAQHDAIGVVCWHIDEITDILTKMNFLFVKSIHLSQSLVDEINVTKDYGEDELKIIGNCLNLAKAVKDIADTPILDNDNQLLESAGRVLLISNDYLSYFSQMMSEGV